MIGSLRMMMQSCPRERGFAGKSWNTHVTHLLSCSFIRMNEMKDRNLFSGSATENPGIPPTIACQHRLESRKRLLETANQPPIAILDEH